MQIEYNQAVDLCIAMFQYAHWDEISSVKIPGYNPSHELTAWHEHARKNISGILDNDIGYIIPNFIGLLFLPVEVALLNGISSVPELISIFRSLPPETLPERVFSSYSTGIPFSEIRDNPEKTVKAVEKAGGTTRKKEPQLFLDFLHDPESMQVRLADMMEEFYHSAVEPFENDVLKLAAKQIKTEQKILDEKPVRFFTGFCRMKYDEDGPDSRILFSYYSEIGIIQMDNPLTIIYGRCRYQFENSSAIPLEQIYKLLSDESRRNILQLLCRKPRFIRDLADELGLTSATVSYHTSRLSALNLVTYERGERKRVYYSADKNEVERMLKAVEADILG